MQHVILGAGPAGVVAAETLCKIDPGSDVTLVAGEDEAPYSRMAIPYVLTEKIGEDGTHLRKVDGHYAAMGINVVHAHAEAVSPKGGTVKLSNGDTLKYDRLLVATGAHPIAPPVPGLDLPGVHHCWTLEDARAIAGRAQKGANVVLMGAGFIGCIILESLVERGVNLTVFEAEDRMIPKMMDKTGGDMLKRWCEEKGVTVLTGTRVAKIEDAGGKLAVSPEKGKTIEAELVVVATGVAPNAGFLEGSDVKIEDGIVVDDHLKSSIDGIYAAGDVAEGPDFSGGHMVHAVQPTSVDHGRIAALNMAGKNVTYQGSLIMNVLDMLGLITASFGHWEGGTSRAEQVDADGFRYTSLSFEDNKLIGALMIGRTDHVGAIRGLIQKKVKLGAWEGHLKKNPNRIMDAFVALSQ